MKIFISHNSADKPPVEELCLRLRKEPGLEPWLDKWNLIPGEAWQPALEEAIATCDVCLICVGPHGVGPWHHEEMRALICRRVADRQGNFRAIPVLLPGGDRGSRSSLPSFLVATTWVEFRRTLDDPDAFQRLIWGIRGQRPKPPESGRVELLEQPYRGLETFDVGHADRFFGREAVTEWLVDDIRKSIRPGSELPRFLALLGASGSGKSSLARAGLYAALRGGAIEGSRGWIYLPPIRPGPHPVESLELAMVAAGSGTPQFDAIRAELRELEQSPDRLHRAARLLVPDSPARRLFLLVDQFEETFTLCAKESHRSAFLAALLHAAREPNGPVVVVLAMRADFYPKIASYEELARVVDQRQFLVGPMNDRELRLAIEEPATRAGSEFEPGLVDKLLKDVHRQPGALPLLQDALMELWNRREDGRRLTHAAYEGIGRLEGALERRANEVLHRFNQEDQELCRRLFLRLVQPGDGSEDTKRRVEVRELIALGQAPRVQKLLETLAAPEVRLITMQGGASGQAGAYVEIAHEALVHSWSELRKWIDSDRAGLRTHRRLTEAAKDWEEAAKSAGLLYSGGRLALVSEWADQHRSELNAQEREFLQASQAFERQQQQDELTRLEKLADAERRAREQAEARAAEQTARRKWLTALASGLLVLSVAAAIAAAWAFRERNRKDTALATSQAIQRFLEHDLLQQADVWEQADFSLRFESKFEAAPNPKVSQLLDRAAVELSPDKIDRKFPGQPAVQASILQTLGKSYTAVGENEKAVECLRRASDLYNTAGAEYSARSLEALSTVVLIYLNTQRFSSAISLAQELCAARTKLLGPNHPDTLASLNRLGLAYVEAGKTTEAIRVFERVLAERKKALGPEHRDTLTTIDDLAMAYEEAKKPAAAIELLEQYIPIEARTLGADHPFTLSAMHNLAVGYNDAGQPLKAIDIFEKFRGTQARIFGPEHPETLMTLASLAAAYEDAGKPTNAIPLLNQVLDAWTRKLGPTHPHTLETLEDLARAQLAAHNTNETLRLVKRAVEGYAEHDLERPQNSRLSRAVVNLEELHDYADAELWRRKMIESLRKSPGAHSIAYADGMAQLGHNLMLQRQWTQAEAVLRETLSLREELQPDAWTTFNLRSAVGGTLLEQGKFDQAEPLLVSGYEGMRERQTSIPAAGRIRLEEAVERLAQLYRDWDSARPGSGIREKADRWAKELKDGRGTGRN